MVEDDQSRQQQEGHKHPISFGGLLRFYRERADLTPEDLGTFAGLNKSRISDWEESVPTTIKKRELFTLKSVLSLSDLDFENLIRSLGTPKDNY
jgi:transcriptional regulator with XRE-family HTH domain